MTKQGNAQTTSHTWIKHPFTSEEKLALAERMARSEAIIAEKADELKSAVASIKAEISAEESTLHSCAEKLRSGYEMRQRECLIDYSGSGMVKYVDKDTGEVLEERAITEDEQLKLMGKVIDAEDIIREDSEKD